MFNSCHVAGFPGGSLVREGVNVNVVGGMKADHDWSVFMHHFAHTADSMREMQVMHPFCDVRLRFQSGQV